MKYERMLCWVRPFEKDELLEVNREYNIPIEFVDSFDEFESKISDDTYNVMALGYSDENTIFFLRKHHDQKFMFFGLSKEIDITGYQLDLFEELNMIGGHNSARELIENYAGIIPDLTALREVQYREWRKQPEISGAFEKLSSFAKNYVTV